MSRVRVQSKAQVCPQTHSSQTPRRSELFTGESFMDSLASNFAQGSAARERFLRRENSFCRSIDHIKFSR